MYPHTADDAKAKHVSQVQEDLWNNITKSYVHVILQLHFKKTSATESPPTKLSSKETKEEFNLYSTTFTEKCKKYNNSIKL